MPIVVLLQEVANEKHEHKPGFSKKSKKERKTWE